MDAIDPALRRSGRFDAEVEVSTPNEVDRLQILKVPCVTSSKPSRLALKLWFKEIIIYIVFFSQNVSSIQRRFLWIQLMI